MKKEKITALLILLAGMILCGFSVFSKETVTADTNKYHIYRYLSADTFLSETEKSSYLNNYVILSGTVLSYDDRSIQLSGENNLGKINCTSKKDIGGLSQLSSGRGAAVYGKFYYDPEGEICLDIEKATLPPEGVTSSDMYFAADGTAFDRAASLERKLAGGRIVYHIPQNWKDIEYNIPENGLGNIEGYQYALNKTAGSRGSEAESLFVCYFDKSLLKDPYDINKPEQAEKAIIENIEGKVNSDIFGNFLTRTDYTYYGTKYQYYLGKYTDALGMGYRTEYIFQPDGDSGIVMYLYLYREPKHISDVMFVTRLLEIR